MEQKPLISVIVPIYKVEKYLSYCIESILKQSFTDFELLLIDDGSPADYALHHRERGRKRNREIFQDYDAYLIYYYSYIGCLLGHSTGSRCGHRVSTETGL